MYAREYSAENQRDISKNREQSKQLIEINEHFSSEKNNSIFVYHIFSFRTKRG